MMDRLLKNSKSRLPQRIAKTIVSRQLLHEKSRFTQRNLTADEISHDDDDDQQKIINNNKNHGQYSGLCGLCHLTVGRTGPGGNNIGFEQPFCCNQGHLICQRCVQHLRITAGTLILLSPNYKFVNN